MVTTDSEELGDNLLVLMTNYGETNRLLRNLQEVAPEEIDVDLDIVIEQWESQQEIAPRAASDPLGSFAASFLGALLASPSYTFVDDFAVRECGRPVFALGATTAGSDPCSWLDSDVGRTVLQTEPIEELLNALATVEENSPLAAQDAAQLIAQIDDLEPPARYGDEALTRLRFAGMDAPQALASVDAGLANECGYEAFGQGAVEDRFATTAQPLSDDSFVDGSFASCTRADRAGGLIEEGDQVQSNRLTGRRVAYSCEGGQIAVLNWNDGHTVWFDEPNGEVLGLTENAILVARAVETDASGLEPALERTSIALIDVESGEVAEVPVFDGRQDDPDRPLISFLHGSGRNALVGVRGEDTFSLRILASDGSLVAERSTPCRSSANIGARAQTLDAIVLDVCGSFVLADVLGGRIADLSEANRLGSINLAGSSRCMTSDLVSVNRSPQVLIDTASGTQLFPLSLSNDDSPRYEGGFATPSTVVLVDDKEAFAVDYDGNPKWSYPQGDYNLDWTIIGDYLVATNVSGERIFVDPDTGDALEPGSEVQQAYERMIGLSSSDTATFPDLVSVDRQNSEAALQSYDHRDRYETRVYSDLSVFCKTMPSPASGQQPADDVEQSPDTQTDGRDEEGAGDVDEATASPSASATGGPTLTVESLEAALPGARTTDSRGDDPVRCGRYDYLVDQTARLSTGGGSSLLLFTNADAAQRFLETDLQIIQEAASSPVVCGDLGQFQEPSTVEDQGNGRYLIIWTYSTGDGQTSTIEALTRRCGNAVLREDVSGNELEPFEPLEALGC